MAALVLGPVLGFIGAALVLVAMILVAATLESALGYCLGCRAFAVLMRAGVVPDETCLACADVRTRLDAA